ncbi:CLUMA_CG009590, isoform A [Clunio marinus]|uniref:CLUMA_CG009590, isoform A n=1 Tax=Clunio marinus TaxID=568069 RepID=A0A1J1ICJ6_9DIPT|nr:CLUMA_CG009590, isoform A [Clunio marinus]
MKKVRRDEELLEAKDKKYNAKCLIGNWSSEKLQQDEKVKQFLEKRERGELLVQQTKRVYETFLAPVQLSAPTTYVSFDQAIQLIAFDMPNIHSTTNGVPWALSVVVNEPHINRCQEIDQHCEITCAPSPQPAVRNTFIIRKPLTQQQRQNNVNDATNTKITADNVSDYNYLKYGQDFMLQCYEFKQPETSLMLYSSSKNPIAHNQAEFVFKMNGEMKQSVRLAMQRANFNAKNFSDEYFTNDTIPSKYFHWRLYHAHPEMRYETIGENIPVRLFILLISNYLSMLTHIR